MFIKVNGEEKNRTRADEDSKSLWEKFPDCEYMDWDCVGETADKLGLSDPCPEDKEECWKKVAEQTAPCKKDDGECWYSFMTEVAEI